MDESRFGRISIEALSSDTISVILLVGVLIVSFLIWLSFRDKIILLGSVLSSPSSVTPSAGQRVCQPCTVCGNKKCDRHKPILSSYHQTFIPESVDYALQQLLEQILEMYVRRWHSKISEDSAFEHQLRIIMQTVVSNLSYRVTQLEKSKIIIDRLLPAIIAHLDILLRQSKEVAGFQHDQEQEPERWPLNDDPYKSLPIDWHPAIYSRHHELLYLRHLTVHILPYIVPDYQLNCKAWGTLMREILAHWVLLPVMDLLADGAIILRFLVHLLEYSPSVSSLSAHSTSHKLVPMLRQFVFNHSNTSASRLRMDLSEVIHDQQMLDHFIQFLKKEGSVHILQFCLDLEKFNNRILNPELTVDECKALYHAAWDIFSLYFQSSSPDFVGFPLYIVQSMHEVLKTGEENILSLRNTPPLFQAFDWAFTKLEKEILPVFNHSDDFFIMLCGGRLSKLKRKKPSRARGEELLAWHRANVSAAFAEIKNDSREVISPEDCGVDVPSLRNLNAWRVSVPRAYLRPEMPGSSRITAVMIISVQRIDVRENDDPDDCYWKVYRSHADFCALASKLQEFHGEFQQVLSAPVRRPPTRGLDDLESWRKEGEEYLQLLLQTPALQNSDLLSAFLSPHIANFAEDIGGTEMSLGRLLSTVMIRKENGQHLQQFINNLLSVSRTSSKKRKNRSKANDDENQNSLKSTVQLKKLDLNHPVFMNNLKQTSLMSDKPMCPIKQESSSRPLHGIFDIITYIMVRFFGASSIFTQVILSVRKVALFFINSYCHRRLRIKLQHAIGPHQLVQIINILRDAISGQRSTSPSSEEIELKNARKVLHYLENLIPWPVSLLPNTHASVAAFISAIRTPLLNKQLAYILLDIIVEELIPELTLKNQDSQVSAKL